VLNQRKDLIRITVPVLLAFKPSKETIEYYHGKLRDISSTGISFYTQEPTMEPGRELELKLRLPWKDKDFHIKGKVVWKRQVRDRFCVGVKFNTVDEEMKREIADHNANMWK